MAADPARPIRRRRPGAGSPGWIGSVRVRTTALATAGRRRDPGGRRRRAGAGAAGGADRGVERSVRQQVDGRRRGRGRAARRPAVARQRRRRHRRPGPRRRRPGRRDQPGRWTTTRPLAPRLDDAMRRPSDRRRRRSPGEDERFLAVAADADDRRRHRGRWSSPRRSRWRTSRSTVVAGLLVLGLPAVLLIVAATTWRVVGRALAPVEAIRATVDAVSADDLSRRVPAPATDDEVARLAATMNRMLDRLETAQRASGGSWPTPPTSCGRRSATIRQHAEVAAPHPGRTTPGRAGRRRAGRGAPDPARWSTTCCCWPGPTRTAWRCAGGRSTSTTSCSTRPAGCGGDGSDGRRHRRVGRRRSTATPTRCAGWSATSSTTPPATPHGRVRAVRCGERRRRRRVMLGGRGRRPRHPGPTSGSGCSSGSCASTTPGPATAAAAGWGWPSSPSWSPPTAARSSTDAALGGARVEMTFPPAPLTCGAERCRAFRSRSATLCDGVSVGPGRDGRDEETG